MNWKKGRILLLFCVIAAGSTVGFFFGGISQLSPDAAVSRSESQTVIPLSGAAAQDLTLSLSGWTFTRSEKQLAVTWVNDGDDDYAAGPYFQLQKQDGEGDWQDYTDRDDEIFFEDIGLEIPAHGSATSYYDLHKFARNLENGIYRIVIPIGSGGGELVLPFEVRSLN